MKKAVRLTMDAEPVLGCKYVVNRRRAYWERRDDIDSLEYFTLIKSDNPELEIRKTVLYQIDPSVESIIQLKIIRSKTNDILYIKSDHSVMDGGGFYDYLTLLCDTYNKLLEDPNYQVEPNVLATRELNQVFKHFKFRKKMRSLLRDKGYLPTWSFPSIGTGRELKTFILRKIEPERFDRIKAYGKERNATLNDMFLTAVFRSLFKLKEPARKRPMTIAVPTDLRVLLPAKKAESIANLVAATFASLKYVPEATFDDMLLAINKQMTKKKDIHLGMGQFYMIDNLFKLRYAWVRWIANRIYKGIYRRGKMHPIITNIGRIDSQKRHFGDVDVEDGHLITPINWAPSFSMGISSFNKKISFSIAFCEDSYDKRTVELFLDYIFEELPQ
jgi:NRPS condensation-like uncharacterized protein